MKQISNRWAISKYGEAVDGGGYAYDSRPKNEDRIVHLYLTSSINNV